MMTQNSKEDLKRGIPKGYRSGLEEKVSRQLEASGLPWSYESMKIRYIAPESSHTYTPDFPLGKNAQIIIETKGRFLSDDRKKHLLIKTQHPELDIRFVFVNPNTKINKGSKTSYADWCNKYGFKWAVKLIPQEWLEEIRRKVHAS
jgi:hypothetical protein